MLVDLIRAIGLAGPSKGLLSVGVTAPSATAAIPEKFASSKSVGDLCLSLFRIMEEGWSGGVDGGHAYGYG